MLSLLTKGERDRLIYAFNEGHTDYIVLEDNTFIGVNVELLPNLKIEKREGAWCQGYVLSVQDDQEKTQ